MRKIEFVDVTDDKGKAERYAVIADGVVAGLIVLHRGVLTLASARRPSGEFLLWLNPWGYNRLEESERETCFERSRDAINRHLDLLESCAMVQP